jgi:hypothetical protein
LHDPAFLIYRHVLAGALVIGDDSLGRDPFSLVLHRFELIDHPALGEVFGAPMFLGVKFAPKAVVRLPQWPQVKQRKRMVGATEPGRAPSVTVGSILTGDGLTVSTHIKDAGNLPWEMTPRA